MRIIDGERRRYVNQGQEVNVNSEIENNITVVSNSRRGDINENIIERQITDNNNTSVRKNSHSRSHHRSHSHNRSNHRSHSHSRTHHRSRSHTSNNIRNNK